MTQALTMIWNPSEGIDLGFFMIRYYSLMWVVAFALGFYVMKKIFIREGESLDKLDSLFFYTIIATMFGARLGHVIFYQSELFKEDFLSVFLPIRTNPEFEFTGFSGLASHGAAIGIIIAMFYYSRNIIKKPMLWVLDRVVLSVSLGAIFIRIGNFINSEILGRTTDSPLGIKFIQDEYNHYQITQETGIANYKQAYSAAINNPEFAPLIENISAKHPVQLYEAFGYVIVFAILYYLYWKTNARTKQGYLFGVFMILLWSIRFFAEFIKESQGGFEGADPLLSTGQWLSIPFIILGFYLIRRSKEVKSVS
jgi:phosphatidylglycerol:prolipoprotein diacylglycerol transferase